MIYVSVRSIAASSAVVALHLVWISPCLVFRTAVFGTFRAPFARVFFASLGVCVTQLRPGGLGSCSVDFS